MLPELTKLTSKFKGQVKFIKVRPLRLLTKEVVLGVGEPLLDIVHGICMELNESIH
jgi:hypothetical protein